MITTHNHDSNIQNTTKIDGIILSLIEKGAKVVEWYIPDYDKSLIALVVCDCVFTSEIFDEIKQSYECTWDVSCCYIWEDTVSNTIIYREANQCTPKNNRWKLRRTSTIHIYFNHVDVGVPERWNTKMRARHDREHQEG